LMSSATIETAPVEVLPVKGREGNSYTQILKSSAWVGGSTVLNIAIGIVRTKVMAILLGPAGFGLNGLYSAVADVAQSVAGMGVNSSGVRQIAESAGSGDRQRIAQTAAVLRRTSLALGFAGAVLLVIFSKQISSLTFGNAGRASAISLLALAVFCKLVSAGQAALVQGMRRISDLAKMQISGAVAGILTGIPLVYLWGQAGIVPALIAVAASMLMTSWWYSRKIPVPRLRVGLAEIGHEAAALLKLGFAFMTSGFLTMGAAYSVRILLARRAGIAATGYYQSAWTLGGLYVGIILQAMAADFYPRLTASIRDHRVSNRIVNEQTEVGLLLAGPGVLGTLTFAPLILALFYSPKFYAAVEILRWISLGTLMQVVSWPMGFIVLAKGRPSIFLASDLGWTIVYLGLAWFLVHNYGLEGAGMAFFASYLFHLLLNYAIARRLSGFRWSKSNRHTGVLFCGLIALVFCALRLLPQTVSVSVGGIALVGATWYSLSCFAQLVSAAQLPAPISRLLLAFHRRGDAA